VKFGGTTTSCGQRSSAWYNGIAERTPNGRASYDAVSTTARRDEPEIASGTPRSAGSSRCATDA
jgi:hypothetical protein